MADISLRTGLLGFDNANHLLRRATYNPKKSRINQFASYTAAQAVDELFNFSGNLLQEPINNDNGLPYLSSAITPNPQPNNMVLGTGLKYFCIFPWLLSNALDSNYINSKLSHFLHSIFIINGNDTGGIPEFEYDYHALLNFFATGSIKSFAKKVSRLNHMHYYLDNRYNTVNSPNENYAREFLELFTITKGPQDGFGSYTNYTEHDVQQAAKILTGFTAINFADRLSFIDAETQIPLGRKIVLNHDSSNKIFSSKFDNQIIYGTNSSSGMDMELDTFIDMIFNKNETAKNYSRRLYRFFVRREISTEIEVDIITPLANNLIATNYDLNSTVKILLKSKHFYDEDDTTSGDEIIGGKIKSPLELILILLNQFQVNIPHPTVNPSAYYNFYFNYCLINIKNCDFPLFQPTNVAGYPAYYEIEYDKLWITTSNLKNRYSIIDNLILGITFNGVIIKLDIVDFIRNGGVVSNPSDAISLVNEILDLCFVSIPDSERYTFFLQSLLGGLSTTSWQFEWDNYISSNNSTAVKIALTRFILAIVKSPEYQIF